MKPEFTDGDRVNPLWAKFMDHFQHRLETLRVDNDRDYDEKKTAEIRGRIAEHKALLGLDKPPVLD